MSGGDRPAADFSLALNEFVVGVAWCHTEGYAGGKATLTTNLGRNVTFEGNAPYKGPTVCSAGVSKFEASPRHQIIGLSGFR